MPFRAARDRLVNLDIDRSVCSYECYLFDLEVLSIEKFVDIVYYYYVDAFLSIYL